MNSSWVNLTRPSNRGVTYGGDMIRVRVVVTGDVQGVFFRDGCRREAQARGVSGWVRNTAAGTVEAELEGEQRDVDAMVAWCRHGPPRATVTGVAVDHLAPTGSSGFDVR